MSLVISLSRPCTSNHCHSSPKPLTCRALLVGPHDKLLLGLLSKISTRQREWPGRRRVTTEGGIPIKPTEHPQTKERDEFLLLLLLLLLTTSKKNSFQLQMAAFWRGKKTHKKVNRNCSMCASVCTAPYIICIPIYLWFKKEAGRAERQPAERWRTAIVLLSCASVTR